MKMGLIEKKFHEIKIFAKVERKMKRPIYIMINVLKIVKSELKAM